MTLPQRDVNIVVAGSLLAMFLAALDQTVVATALTSIAVSTVPATQWTIAGRTLAGHAKSAYWVDIKITDATNTKTEMARYVAAVHAALARVLGDVHVESYVLVHEVHAAAYGYGGKTQERRYIESPTPTRAGAA